LVLKIGDKLSPLSFEAYLTRAGYVLDARVAEPGEAALHGKVIDIFLAGSAEPVRIEHHHETIVAFHSFDANLQLTGTEASEVTIYSIVEYSLPSAIASAKPRQRSPENAVRLLAEGGSSDAEARRTAFMNQIAEARQIRTLVGEGHHPARAHLRLVAAYPDEAIWSHRWGKRNIIIKRPSPRDWPQDRVLAS
jgi:transcription-repair coupling factor (superfamily II helicase)